MVLKSQRQTGKNLVAPLLAGRTVVALPVRHCFLAIKDCQVSNKLLKNINDF
jgi:hypothetical protein